MVGILVEFKEMEMLREPGVVGGLDNDVSMGSAVGERVSFPDAGNDTNGGELLDASDVGARVVMFEIVTEVLWLPV
jgi:hypothetical protein